MSEVGALIIKLQAETAQFREDMGKVKSDLDGLKGKAGEAGAAMDYSMLEARGSVVLLGDQFGVHMPREISRMIATIPGVGLALESLLPIMGVVFGAEMIYKWIEANEAKAAAKAAWDGMDDAANAALHKMDEEILSTGARVDDLDGKHLEALQKRLKLIDDQSLDKLADEFTKIAASADKVLDTLKAGWYQELQGKGDGVEEVKNHFDELQAKLQDMKASGDVNGFAAALSQGIKETMARQDELNHHASSFHTEERAALAAELNALISQTQEMEKQAQISDNKKTAEKTEAAKRAAEEAKKAAEFNITAQKQYTDAIKESREAAVALGVEQRKMAGGGAKDESGEKAQKEADEFFKKTEDEARNHQLEMARIATQGDEQSARHALAMRQASIQQMMRLELDAAKKEHDLDIQADQERLRELESADTKDYAAIQKMHDKMLEDEKKFQNQKTAIIDKAEEDREKFAQQRAQAQAADMAKALNAELFDHKHAAKALEQIGRQMLETQVEQGMLALMGQETQAEREALIAAKKAARGAYSSVMDSGLPAPIAFPLAVAAGAAAFAGTMAFEQGGEIPGIGAVPIIGHGGETVVTKALSDQVKSGGLNNRGGDSHVHIHASAMDAEGLDRVFEQAFFARSTSTSTRP